MEWLISHWEVIAGIGAGVLMVAAGIAKLTKSEEDDKVVAKVKDYFDKAVGWLKGRK